jgi:hypothetical protein
MRKVLFLICVLGISSASLAKTDQTSWANLNALQAGQKIQVVEVNSKKHSGLFASVSDDAISFQESGSPQSIPKQNVRMVKLMKNKHRLRNTAIGAAVGAGAGAAVGAASKGNDSWFGTGDYAAVGAVVGAVLGAVVGVLIPGHETVYKVSSH